MNGPFLLGAFSKTFRTLTANFFSFHGLTLKAPHFEEIVKLLSCYYGISEVKRIPKSKVAGSNHVIDYVFSRSFEKKSRLLQWLFFVRCSSHFESTHFSINFHVVILQKLSAVRGFPGARFFANRVCQRMSVGRKLSGG